MFSVRCAVLALSLLPVMASAESIGEVSTVFKWVGPNDKIVVEAFDDPKVEGVTCYLSRAKTGGVKGGFGLAEDRAEASIACRQVGPVRFVGQLKDGEEVLQEPKRRRRPDSFRPLTDRFGNPVSISTDKTRRGPPTDAASAQRNPADQPGKPAHGH